MIAVRSRSQTEPQSAVFIPACPGKREGKLSRNLKLSQPAPLIHASRSSSARSKSAATVAARHRDSKTFPLVGLMNTPPCTFLLSTYCRCSSAASSRKVPFQQRILSYTLCCPEAYLPGSPGLCKLSWNGTFQRSSASSLGSRPQPG